MAETDNINPGPLDQSKVLTEQIQAQVKEVVRLYKQLGADSEMRNRIEEEYIEKLKSAKGNLGSLSNLNEELLNRIQGVAISTDAYSEDIVSVGRELDRVVGSISTTTDYSRQILKDFKSLREVATNIKNDKDLTRVMSVEDLQSSKEQVDIDQKSLETQVQRAAAAINFRGVNESINTIQTDISNQILEQDAAIRSANGKLGGQVNHLNQVRSYFSQINELATNENISTEKSLELSEQRNQISSVLNNALDNNITKNVEEEQLVQSIISKLQNKEQISRNEFGVMTQILNRKEQGYKDEREAATQTANFSKNSLLLESEKVDKARSVIEELKTEGKLSDDNNFSLEEKVSILTENQQLLAGINERDRVRVIKAIESNKALKDNQNLYSLLTSEIDNSIIREEKLKDTVGLTGAAVKELSKIPVLASVFKAEDVKEVTDEVRRLNKEYEDKASLETVQLKNSIANQFTEIQSISNNLTEDQSKQLTKITSKLQNNQQLTEEENNIAQELSEKILNTTEIETKRKDILQKISELSEDDQKALKSVVSKVENKKTLTEEELRVLESKTGVETKGLNINEDILKTVREQGANLKINAEEVSKGQAAMMMFNKAAGNLKKLLTDPAAIFSAIATTLLRNSNLTNEFQQRLGMSYPNALRMRNELELAAGASNDLFITSEKLQKSFFALADATGVFFDLSSQSAETFTNLTERIGLAANEAGNLTTLLRLQGKDTETTMTNLVETTSATLAVSKAGVSVKEIFSDVAQTSKGLQASFAANPGALAKAAIAARELGTTLKGVEQIQSSLLNFESSIGAELEAELLTGKQLNLERARTAALNNDIEGVSKELSKQGVDLASFGKMNVIQQEAMAKAMGLSRDTMGDMLLRQQTLNMTANEVREQFGEQTYEQFKALSAQDKFNAAVDKVKDLFGSVMTILTPIIDGLASVLGIIAPIVNIAEKLNKALGGIPFAVLAIAIAAKAMGSNLAGVLSGTGNLIKKVFSAETYSGFFGGLKQGWSMFTNNLKAGWNNFTSGLSSAKDKLGLLFKKDTYAGFFTGLNKKFSNLGGTIKGFGEKLSSMFGGAADASKGIQFDPRMAGGGKFRDMASGRLVSEEAANAAGVFKPGTGPAAAAASGVTDAASATGATPAPADNGKALKEKMQNIAEGIKAFADTQVLKGAFNMLLSAPGILAFGIAALPLKLIEKINGPKIMASMKGISQGIASFAQASAGIVPLLGASAAFAVLGLGLPGLAGIALLGTPAAAGLLALGPAIASLVVAAPGIPILLAIGATLALASAPMFAAAMVLEAVANVITSLAGAFVIGIQAISSSIVELANNVSFSQLAGVAGGIALLGSSVAFLGTIFPAIILGSLALGALTLAIIPLSAASEGISVLADGFIRVAEAIQTLDIGKIGLLGISVAALTTSLAGLLTLGPIGLTALAVLGGVAAVGVAAVGVATASSTTPGTTPPSQNLAQNTESISISNATITAKSLSLEALNNTSTANITATSTVSEPVSSLANLITKQNTSNNTEIVPGISVTTPPSTTTQETLTTNTENLATTTSNATTSLEEFTTKVNASNLTERTKQQFIDAKTRSLGIKPEVEVIDLDTKNTTTSTVDQSSVASNTTTSIVDQPSVLPPPPTVTQENLVTSTKNLSTSTLESANQVTTSSNINIIDQIKDSITNTIDQIKSSATDIKNQSSLFTNSDIFTKTSIAAKELGTPSSNNSPLATGIGISPLNGTNITTTNTVETTKETSNESMRAMIEETVTSTINALVPEMVNALKEGQGNIKVTNDNFNASSQKELPSQLRNISNSNFA